jgi:hypothetical protein
MKAKGLESFVEIGSNIAEGQHDRIGVIKITRGRVESFNQQRRAKDRRPWRRQRHVLDSGNI